MSKGWNYKAADWWVICDSCSKKIKASHSKHRWDGLIVCDNCFEHRHSQDFIKVRQDKITVPFLRPRPEDVFVNVCTLAGSSGYAGLAEAGCAQVGNTTFSYSELVNTTCTFQNRSAVAGTAVSGCSVAGKTLMGTL